MTDLQLELLQELAANGQAYVDYLAEKVRTSVKAATKELKWLAGEGHVVKVAKHQWNITQSGVLFLGNWLSDNAPPLTVREIEEDKRFLEKQIQEERCSERRSGWHQLLLSLRSPGPASAS